MTSTDGDIDTRAEAVRNLRMAENELASGHSLARAVRVEMHTRIAAVWSDLTPRAEAAPLASQGGSRVLAAQTVARPWEEPRETTPERVREDVRTPTPTHTPGQRWRDTAGDVWTAVGFLDRGDVLVISGQPEELADWPDVSPIAEVDLYTLAHVEGKWGPLEEIEHMTDKETDGG